jgi:predicted heme/steroid binding protein
MKKAFLGVAIGIMVIAGGIWIISNNSSQIPAPQNESPAASASTTPKQPVSQKPVPVIPLPTPPAKTPGLPVKKPPVATPPPVPVKPPGPRTFTMAEIANHNSQSSCYTAISGSVYDLTPFINQHPGGARNILIICGIDGTAAFMNQHSGQSRPEQILTTFKIGVVVP